jgi:hypothetical protein
MDDTDLSSAALQSRGDRSDALEIGGLPPPALLRHHLLFLVECFHGAVALALPIVHAVLYIEPRPHLEAERGIIFSPGPPVNSWIYR